MKKIFFVVAILLILFFSFTSLAVGQVSEERPMASFMEAKWGMTAAAFTMDFKYKDQLKKDDDFFYLDNFELGDVVIPKIRFKFVTKSGEQVKLRGRNYDSLYLSEAFMFIKSDQFETLFQIFKLKYGEPKKYDEFDVRDSQGKSFLQKVALWEDQEIKRSILMEKQASKLVDGMITLIPIKEKVVEEKKDKIKEAAEKI